MFIEIKLIYVAQGSLVVCRGFEMSPNFRSLSGCLRSEAQYRLTISGKGRMVNKSRELNPVFTTFSKRPKYPLM
jgi:hypothetical protein